MTQFGLVGRIDADGVADASGNLTADREGRPPRRSVDGRGCYAVTRNEEFLEDAARSTEQTTARGVPRIVD